MEEGGAGSWGRSGNEFNQGTLNENLKELTDHCYFFFLTTGLIPKQAERSRKVHRPSL